MERTVKSDLCYSCTLGHLHCGGKLRRKKTVRKTGLGIIYCTGRIQNSYNNPSPALVGHGFQHGRWMEPASILCSPSVKCPFRSVHSAPTRIRNG
eukprot:1472901-Pyramimonas_sp.AAC.1